MTVRDTREPRSISAVIGKLRSNLSRFWSTRVIFLNDTSGSSRVNTHFRRAEQQILIFGGPAAADN